VSSSTQKSDPHLPRGGHGQGLGRRRACRCPGARIHAWHCPNFYTSNLHKWFLCPPQWIPLHPKDDPIASQLHPTMSCEYDNGRAAHRESAQLIEPDAIDFMSRLEGDIEGISGPWQGDGDGMAWRILLALSRNVCMYDYGQAAWLPWLWERWGCYDGEKVLSNWKCSCI